MRLDRNINKDGSGKYALLKLRDVHVSSDGDVHNAIKLLGERGMIHWGTESLGDQFFVMKYKDVFTAPALRAYHDAVLRKVADLALHSAQSWNDPQALSLREYESDLAAELTIAQKVDKRLPD